MIPEYWLERIALALENLTLVQMAHLRAKKNVEKVDFVKREGVLYLNVRQYDGFQSLTWEVDSRYIDEDNEDPTP